MAKKSKLNSSTIPTDKLTLDELDIKIVKDAIQRRKDYVEKELATYSSLQSKITDINLKNIKGANWLVWVWAIPIIIWISPLALGFFISLYIERYVKIIFKEIKKLTYALIRDIKKFIKSKFGNKLSTNS